MFTFQPAPAPAAATESTSTPALQFPHAEPYRSLFLKWGFLRPGEWNVHTYRYTGGDITTAGSKSDGATPSSASVSGGVQSTSTAAASQTPQVSAASLRFHHGVAADFLRALFASPCVRAALNAGGAAAAAAEGKAGARGDEVDGGLHYRPLTCTLTTLEPLRHALVDAKVVRQVALDAEPSSADVEDETGEARLVCRLPTVKRAEEVLPDGQVISDELRALFLRAHSRLDGYAGSAHGVADDRDDAMSGGDSADDNGDDDDDAWGAMSGAQLPLRQLRGVFGRAARRELLYHILWRLIAGSGPLNQFEDDAAVYLDAAREVYRGLVRSFHVREVVEQAGAGDVTAIEEADEAATGQSTRYEAVVDTAVYEVRAAPGVRLFPRSDGVAPSNLNYCYVAVNPSEQSVTVWHHAC